MHGSLFISSGRGGEPEQGRYFPELLDLPSAKYVRTLNFLGEVEAFIQVDREKAGKHTGATSGGTSMCRQATARLCKTPHPVPSNPPSSLQVTRGGSKLDHSLKAYRPQPAPTSSNQRAPRRWPEPKGRNEYEQQKQQPHQPQSRPERGVRRQAPVSSSGSVAASTAAKQATQSSHRDASPDPLGALRSPRPSAASYKDTPASAKPDVNGRLIIGYGGKTNYRDSSSRDTAGGKANGAGVRRTEKYPATRPTNTARPGFQTGGRRP